MNSIREPDPDASRSRQVPTALRELAQHEPSAASWLGRLPRVLTTVSRAWGLELGEPYPNGNVSYVVPARRGDERVVLKIQWPHEECRHEADALRIWDGDGAIRLLDQEPSHHALLLERCAPGTSLADAVGIDRIGELVALLPRLWKQADKPFRSLADEARDWRTGMHANWDRAGRPCERALVDAAASLLEDLIDSQGEQVLLHQDLHGDNVLAAGRSPWLAIDPKPLVGEREFSLAPIIRSTELGTGKRALVKRLDRLSAELDLDRERARGWAIGQSLAWSWSGTTDDRTYRSARWLLEAS